MHKKFDNQAIEKKWQEKWKTDKIYDTGPREDSKEKEYVLVELPYPSGNLHIGHWHAFSVPDIYVRFLRMQGKQVLFPMGFDAFGLPAENAAIKHGRDPRDWTESNIAFMKTQLESMGSAFSWDKTASTTDPEYYKWTQWMFTKFFEKDIAYRGEATVNWDPVDNTVIANEQVLPDGTSDRSGALVEKKIMPQWMLRITNYADRLVDDLEDLNWPEPIKEAQRRWIGRSEGAEIDFKLSTGAAVTVFTTRPDTLFGATHLVLAPELTLELIQEPEAVENLAEVEAYIKKAAGKDEITRTAEGKEKTGVKLEGVTAINPASGEAIPVYVADYVLASYGTGAIMAVPAHDERDFDFASKFGIETKQVIRKVFGEPLLNPEPRVAAGAIVHNPKDDTYLIQYSHEFKNHSFIFGGLEEGESYAEAALRETLEETGYTTVFERYITDETESHFYHPGKDINRSLVSRRVLLTLVDEPQTEVAEEELMKAEPVWMTKEELFKKLTSEEERYAVEMLFSPTVYAGAGKLCNSGEFDGMGSEEAKAAITKKVGGKMTNTYRLRDWSIGRQRYWGVPIPIVYDPDGQAHLVPEEHLPWLLPEDVDPKPTGEPPLAKSKELKERTEKIFGAGWTPEVETMDTFVDSSWYFLRYFDNANEGSLASLEAQKDWMPINIYFGGAEHTTMHLLYSRFWQKALFDLGLVTVDEPYTRRINRGLVLGPDGNKMSKSKGNVIDPDVHVKKLGADTVKMYLAFMGPYAEVANYPWDMGGIAGVHRFLERVNGLSEHIVSESESAQQPSSRQGLELMERELHKTIDKVSRDIGQFKFNTAISSLMVFVNQAEKNGLTEDMHETFLKIMAPFAPHLTEELWQGAGKATSIHLESFPEADPELLKVDKVTIGVQVNGKLRGSIELTPDETEAKAVAAAKADPKVVKYLEGNEPKKVIYVPGKILNLII